MAESTDILDARQLKVIEALVECKGIISDAAIATKVQRSTIYSWMNSSEAFKAAVEDAREVSIDRVEKKLFDLIDRDDTTATIFFLKTRGKKRGYVERQEFAGPDGQPLTTPPPIINVFTQPKD